jgi:hypothetical protein
MCRGAVSTVSASADYAMQLAPRTLHLTTLKFDNCRIPPDPLRSLLGACINLKSLALIGVAFDIYDPFHLARDEPHLQDELLTSSDITQALVYCEHTLEELYLDVYELLTQETYRMTFSNLSKLHKLVITRDILPTHPSSCLPSTLETLELIQCDLEEEILSTWPFWGNVKAAANCPLLRNITMTGGAANRATLEKLLDLAEECEFGSRVKDGHLVENVYPSVVSFTGRGVRFVVDNEEAGTIPVLLTSAPSSSSSSEHRDSPLSSGSAPPNAPPLTVLPALGPSSSNSTEHSDSHSDPGTLPPSALPHSPSAQSLP